MANDDAFVCSMISYLEVKLVVFGNWFTNLSKITETRGRKVLKKTSFRVGMELKKVHAQGGDGKA